MKKYLLFFMLALFQFSVGMAQNTFFKTYNPDGVGFCAKASLDGGIIAVGEYAGSLHDFYIWKTDSVGDTLWTRTFGGIGSEIGRDIVQTYDGGYFAVGNTNSFGSGGDDVYAIRIDMSGNLLWSKTFGGTDDDYGLSVVQTADSGFLIGGHTLSFGAGNEDMFLIRLNYLGDTLWTKTIGGAANDFVHAIQYTNDSGFIISGFTTSFGAGQGDIVLIKLNYNGVIDWSKTLGENDKELGGGIQQTSDGGYILSGYKDDMSSQPHSKVLLIKTDSTGNQMWTRKYSNGTFFSTSIENSSLQLTPDGGYIFTTVGGHENFIITKTNGSGVMQQRAGFAAGEANSIHPVSGGFIVCGVVESAFSKPALVRVDTNGFSCFYLSLLDSTEADNLIVMSFTPMISSGCIVTSPLTLQGSAGTVEINCSSVGISEEKNNDQILVFPNPSHGTVSINFESFTGTSFINVFNTLGEIVFEKALIGTGKTELELQNLPQGLYYVQMIDGEKCATKKFIVL